MAYLSPVLPGTPVSTDEKNAQRLLNAIVSLNQIIIATGSPIFEFESLPQKAQDLTADLLWNDTDGAESLRDAAQQYLRELHLHVKAYGHNFGWSADGWEIDYHSVQMHPVAGTGCRVDVTPTDAVAFYFCDAHHKWQPLTLTDEETEALQAYAWHVVV
jgi:hypothetical protein